MSETKKPWTTEEKTRKGGAHLRVSAPEDPSDKL